MDLEPALVPPETEAELRGASDSIAQRDATNGRVQARAAAGAVRADGVDTIDGATILRALRALRNGDLRAHLPEGGTGIEGSIAEAFNDIVELNRRTTGE